MTNASVSDEQSAGIEKEALCYGKKSPFAHTYENGACIYCLCPQPGNGRNASMKPMFDDEDEEDLKSKEEEEFNELYGKYPKFQELEQFQKNKVKQRYHEITNENDQ